MSLARRCRSNCRSWPKIASLALAAVCLWAAHGEQAEAAKTNEPRVGRKIDAFTLDDYRGAARSLADFSDNKLLVVAFMGTECPLANLYTPRLAELAAAYESKGVAFVGINANQQDSITEVASHAQRHGVPFWVLKDPGNRVADQFGAVRTPEVFLLDEDRVVRYWGRIDDQFGIGYQKSEAGRQDLQAAIDELLAGKPVSVPRTEAPGCFIGRVHRPDPSGDVTYTKQIARILQSRCVECHHDGQIAPFALTNYDEVVGWAEMIREVIHERRMPPWLAAPGHDEFKNNPSMIGRRNRAGRPLGRQRLPPGRPRRHAAAGRLCRGLGHLRAGRNRLHERRAV